MTHRQHHRPLQLSIATEAEALVTAFGAEALRTAQRRALEASSDQMAKDWTGVAAAIASRRRMRLASIVPNLLH